MPFAGTGLWRYGLCRDILARTIFNSRNMLPGKRGPGADEPVLKSELDQFLSEWKAQIANEHKMSQQQFVVTVEAHTTTLFSQLQASTDAKFQVQDAKLDELHKQFQQLRTSQDELGKDNTNLRREMESLSTSMARAEQATVTQAEIDAEDFSREPRLNVLRVGSEKLLSKAAVATAIDPWLSRLGIPADQIILNGPAAGSQFELSFQGAGMLAADRARKANRLLRKPDGSWEEIFGITAASENAKLFIGPDEPPVKRTTRRFAKKLKESFLSQAPTPQPTSARAPVHFLPLAIRLWLAFLPLRPSSGTRTSSGISQWWPTSASTGLKQSVSCGSSCPPPSRAWSGLFNRLLFPAAKIGRSPFCVKTWNAR